MANDFRDIGRDIRDAVLDAVNSGDYSQLNRRISGSVNAAIDEVNARMQASRAASEASFPRWESANVQYRPESRTVSHRQEQQLYARRPAGLVSGILCTVFGAIAFGAFGIGTAAILVNFLIGSLGKLFSFSVGGLLAVLTVTGLAVLAAGQKRLRFVKRFRRYAEVLRGKTFCAISELADRTGKSERFVLRDLKTMISGGLFLQGHIDDEQKTLLLTDEVYSHYRELQKRTEEHAAQQAAQAEESEQERLFRETLAEGERYLSAIRRANDAIPGEVVSEKLFRLERVVQKIFVQVKRNPAQIPELRRFLDYYMPMTQKLIETYQELDAQPMAGENILRAKEEIEKTLDTVNQAFETLFDNLFEHTAVDITSDIAVLKNMLRQEGLTGKDFR